MSKFLKRSAHGAEVPHEKRTSNLETVVMPLPSKIVLSMCMILGRLEIIPVLVLFSGTAWKKS